MDDIAILLEHFLPNLPLDERNDLLRGLLDRPWLGNVRELRNFVERAATFGAARALAMSEPPSRPSGAPPSMRTPPTAAEAPTRDLAAVFDKPYRDFREDAERIYIERLLERHGGNVSAAAQAAGIDRTYIHRLIKKHQG
jgi:DNA-binding NtrC family response regulator